MYPWLSLLSFCSAYYVNRLIKFWIKVNVSHPSFVVIVKNLYFSIHYGFGLLFHRPYLNRAFHCFLYEYYHFLTYLWMYRGLKVHSGGWVILKYQYYQLLPNLPIFQNYMKINLCKSCCKSLKKLAIQRLTLSFSFLLNSMYISKIILWKLVGLLAKQRSIKLE